MHNVFSIKSSRMVLIQIYLDLQLTLSATQLCKSSEVIKLPADSEIGF